jgi:hypothetical protein
MGRFRRALLLLAGALLLIATVALAADFSPRAGSYSGATPAGHHVRFEVDVLDHQVKNFELGGTRLFDTAAFKDVNGTWSFEHASDKYRVEGHWTSAGDIHGTIQDALGLSAHYDAAHVSPRGGVYSPCSTGPRVEFHVDLHTQKVENFKLDGYTYFTSTTFSFGSGRWRFVHVSSKYEIHGEWIAPGEVSGSFGRADIPTGHQSFCARG